MPLDETQHLRSGRHKQRACLRCAKHFDSAWAGERVCPHCKNSAVWREDHAGSSDNHARYGIKARRHGAS
jgi:hypothetical protein